MSPPDASLVARLRSFHVNLRTKLLLPLVFVIAALTGATLLVVRQFAETQAQAQIEQEVRNAILTVQTVQNQHELALDKKADIIAMIAYMRDGDSSAIDDATEDPWHSSDCTLFALADRKGRIVKVRSTRGDFTDTDAKRLLARPLQGNRRSAWWVDNGRVFQILLKPFQADGSLLGTVIVGRELTDKDVKDLAATSSIQVLVSANRATLLTTLSAAQSLSVEPDSRRASLDGMVTVGDERFFAKSVALVTGENQPAIYVTVLKSYDSALVALNELKQLLIALGISALVMGGLLVYFIADRLTRPLTALALGVRALQRGDYVYPLGRPVGRDEVSQLTSAFGEMRSAMRQAETQKQELETQLRQAQKMEAMGRLAGGVAHDFNNLLTVIKGSTSILADGLGANHRLVKFTTQIDGAAERAVSLTRQLLAFCRMQLLQPKILDLNELVSEMCKLLRRLVREDIAFNFRAGESLGRVKADPGQIEQVLMNLVVNAGDAMPSGGTLTVETRNVEITDHQSTLRMPIAPGLYVLLSVTDTGMGMDDDTKARIFEPFFTTKEQGKGTGLGLATVYGIVKQSGGFICVHSELGRGACFEIYLPRVSAEVEPTVAETCVISAPQGNKTVLIAEDEEAVRELAAEFLKSAGYNVLVAKDGSEALELARNSSAPIDALLTDLVMPRMRGPELAKKLKQLQPRVKVIYVSGYLEYQQDAKEFVEDALFLQKPYARTTLVARVGEILQEGLPVKP